MYKSQVEPLKRLYICVKNRSPLPYKLQCEGWKFKLLNPTRVVTKAALTNNWTAYSQLKQEDYHVFDPAGNDLTAEMYIVAEDIEMALKFIDPKYHNAVKSTAHLIELKRKQLETMFELQLSLVQESKKKR